MATIGHGQFFFSVFFFFFCFSKKKKTYGKDRPWTNIQIHFPFEMTFVFK